VNSVGWRSTSKPTGFTIAWITCPSRAWIGSVPIISFTFTGALAFARAKACRAALMLAVRRHGRPLTAAYHGLCGAQGKQSGWFVPPKTTRLMTLRSMASSNAWRKSAERAIGVPTFS
jgi:hypothetical protein